MDIRSYIEDKARRAKLASVLLRPLEAERKNRALEQMAFLLEKKKEDIIRANAVDLESGRKAGLPNAMLDRLLLDTRRIDAMKQSVAEIKAFEDPVGETVGVRRPQGFILEKIRIPIGVIGIIYESRPNVTVDAAALCLKSGNSVILRGGKESIESNRSLTSIIQEAIGKAGLPQDAVQYIERPDHGGVTWLVKQHEYVDLIIPRGGEALIKNVVGEATVPVIKHYKGVCHLYVDDEADLDMALEVVHNAKVQRSGTCNALETLLVHEKVSPYFLKMVREKLSNVEIRGCDRSKEILPDIKCAEEEDYYAEYLGLTLAVRIVGSLEEAVEHIEKYGSSHTDGILSQNTGKIQKFVQLVDSAVVTVNASTRLSDGGVFGLGAEVGISTDKLHARGPMGVQDLTTYKWVVRGQGDLRL
jgi:glutamate-5-semialdehyde dehydrogenase